MNENMVYNWLMPVKIRLNRIRWVLRQYGGKGSGHFDHAGRPGHRGGSAPSGVATRKLPVSKGRYTSLLKQLQEGGFTYQPVKDFSPTTGFMVSPYQDREGKILGSEVTHDDIMEYAEKNADLLTNESHYLGGWLNEEDGYAYLDISIRATSKEEANRIGCEHKQLAYFDLATFETINTECN